MKRTNDLQSRLYLSGTRRSANATRLSWGFLQSAPLAFAAAMLADVYWDYRGYDEIGTIGSFHLHVVDIAAATVLIALIASSPGMRRLNFVSLLVGVIVIVITYTIFRGMMISSSLALFAFRPRAVPILFLIFVTFSRKKPDPFSSYEPWIFFWTSAIFALFFLRTIFGPTLFLAHDSTSYIQIANLEFRPLFATSVIFLVLVLILVLEKLHHAGSVTERHFYIVLLIVTFVVIVLSRQRTGLVACLIAVSIFYLADYKNRRRSAFALVFVAVGLFATSLILASELLPELVALLPSELQSSFEKTSTLAVRQQIWDYSLGVRFANWDILRQLFGPPLGERLDILVSGALWQSSLHSQYIATIMNYGVVGALAWSALILIGIINAFIHLRDRQSNRVGLSPRVVLAWFGTLLVYGFSYEWSNGAGFFVAVVLAGWPTIRKSKKMLFQQRKPLPMRSIVRNSAAPK